MGKVFASTAAVLLALLLDSCTMINRWRGINPDAEEAVAIDPTWNHPQNYTAWHTQVLVMQFPSAAAAQIATCQTMLNEVATAATDEQSMLRAKDSLQDAMRADPKPYHRCFYALAHKMDGELEAPAYNFQQRSEIFLVEMKKLWLLSRALVRVRNDNAYFDYLRTRYVEISNRVFGRKIEVVGTPLDEVLILAPKTEGTVSGPGLGE